MAKNKLTKDPWTISIVTAIFSLLLTMGYDYSKSKPILTTILMFLNMLGNLFVNFLNFDLKVWWLLVGLLIFIISKLQEEESSKPDFYNYREDQFKRWKWTWSWKWSNSENAWIISNMKAHCPNCDTPLIEHLVLNGLSFDCPRCEFSARDGQCDESHKIERIILDNIDRRRNEAKKKP